MRFGFCVWVLRMGFAYGFCVWVLRMGFAYGFCVWVLRMGFAYGFSSVGFYLCEVCERSTFLMRRSLYKCSFAMRS
jgi:nitrate reductase NapE component